jgi:hypothetical protein
VYLFLWTSVLSRVTSELARPSVIYAASTVHQATIICLFDILMMGSPVREKALEVRAIDAATRT